jgi:hypothetical protein
MAIISGTYNFQSLENDDLILECFERIGFAGDQLVPVQLQSARRSLNFLLLDWISKSINLWTINKEYLPLNTGQSRYTLGTSITDILEVLQRTFTRQLNGTSKSNTAGTYDGAGGGNPLLAFDNDFSTSCVQNVADGNISYTYGAGNTQTITFIGVRTNISGNYNLVVEYSNDNINWSTLNVDWTHPYSYETGVTRWVDVVTPVAAMTYRIREIGGAILNLQEIYFGNSTIDLRITPISRDTYLSFSQKYLQGRPTTYYFDKSLSPNINLWPTPTNDYLVLQYSFVKTMYDVGEFYNTTSVPARMYPALAAGLTWMLSVKYKPEMADSFKAQYDEVFTLATANDSENVDMTIGYDLNSYYEN